MAKKGLYKFRWKEQRHIAFDIAVMTAGLVMGVLAVTAIFRFAGLMDFGGGVADLRGAATERSHLQQPDRWRFRGACEESGLESLRRSSPPFCTLLST